MADAKKATVADMKSTGEFHVGEVIVKMNGPKVFIGKAGTGEAVEVEPSKLSAVLTEAFLSE